MVARPSRRLRGTLAALVLGLGMVLVSPGVASAGLIVYYSAGFSAFPPGAGEVVVPTGGAGHANVACLTEEQPNGAKTLPVCRTSTYPREGKLRLTDFAHDQVGGLFLTSTVPGDAFVATSLNTYQHGTADVPGDGLALVVAAVDPANPRLPSRFGAPGGGLGYAPVRGVSGLPYGYLGFGLDVYGGFSRTGNQGSGCPSVPFVSADAPIPGQVVVRGPGQKGVGYCALASTAASPRSAPVPLHARSLQGSEVPVEAALNPTGRTIGTAAGTTVEPGTFAFTFTPVGGGPRTVRGALPTVPAGLYPDGWLDAAGHPKRLALGFVATTGGTRDFHEVDWLLAYREPRPAKLTVKQEAYLAASPAVGDPVGHVVRIGTGLPYQDQREAQIRARVTLPDGERPLGGSGVGWRCDAPVGQRLDCHQDQSRASSRSDLGRLVVQGQVSGSGLTAAAVAAGTRVEVSAAAGAATVVSAPATVMPDRPGPTDLEPLWVRAPADGYVTLQGTRLSETTLVRVGTPAELAAGTAPLVVPCASYGELHPCFNLGAGAATVVTTLPAHQPGPVRIELLGLGHAASVPFTITVTPQAPWVIASYWQKVLSVIWNPAGQGTSPITGWTVTPYRNGVKQAPIQVAADKEKAVIPGVKAGEKYVFTVAGTNASGTGDAGTSDEVVVY
jgi:hypothetical protein